MFGGLESKLPWFRKSEHCGSLGPSGTLLSEGTTGDTVRAYTCCKDYWGPRVSLRVNYYPQL